MALAMTVTVALLGLTIASYTLYLASGGSGAVALQVAQYCPSGLDASVLGKGPLDGVNQATSSLESRSNAALVEAGAGAGALTSPIVTLDELGIGMRSATHPDQELSYFQLASRTMGLGNITVLRSAGGSGIWLSNDLADNMGVTAGDYVTIANDPSAGAVRSGGPTSTVRVAGVYESLVGTVLPRFWCTQTNIFGTIDAAVPPPPVVLATQGTFTSILKSLGQSSVSSYQFERTLASNLTVPQSADVLSGLQHLSSSVGIFAPGENQPVTSSIGGGLTGYSQVDNELGFVVQHARAIQNALGSGILPVALAGLAVTALLVAAAGSYWVDRRRLEVALLSARGASPVQLGAKAALESLFPALVGAIVGWGVAFLLVSGVGPSSSIPPGSTVEALWTSLAGGACALLLVWLIAALRVRGAAKGPRFAQRRVASVPFELVPLGISIWAWSHLGQQSLQAQGASAPNVSASFLIFPILFVLSIAVLSARVAAGVISARWFRRVTSSVGHSAWLASRRLAGSSRIAALCLASVAAAVGVLIYGSALSTSQSATLYAKAAVFVGSATSVQLASPAPVPPSLASDSTEVLVSPNGLLDGQAVDVVAVDPKTFARGGFWNKAFGGQSLQTLLNELQSAKESQSIPAIVAGGSGLSGSLTLRGYGQFSRPIGIDVLSYVSVFAGQNSQDPLVVTTLSGIKRFDVANEEQIWSTAPDQKVLSDLQRAGDTAAILVSVGDVLDQTTFQAITWTFAYLQALGILSGAVIVGGLLLFVSTRARQRALAYVLSRRMGLRRITHWLSLVLEIGVMIAPGAVIGGVVGWIAVVLAEPHLNPLPLLNPPPLLEIPGAVIAGGSAVALCVWALVSGWAQHVADRSKASELLRAEG